jgi:type I restriction enzyme S subunit
MHLTQPDRPIMYGIVLPGPDVGDGVPILKGGNVRPDRMKLASLARTTPEIESPYARARLREGDLVYSIRGSIGDCELVPRELQGSNITQDVARVAPRADISASWLRYSLLSEPIRQALASGSLGAAVRGVNIFDLKRARVPTPPLDEQESLVKYLTTSLDRLDSLASQTQLTIALSNERRAALIAAAVTGKIDVEASQ